MKWKFLNSSGLICLMFLMAGCASYKTNIAISALEEVIKDEKICAAMIYDDEYLLLKVDSSFGKIKIKRVGNQKVKIMTAEELDEIAMDNENYRKYVFIMMKNRNQVEEVTVSYNCIFFIEENGKTRSLHDHFCRGGMVLLFTKVGNKWEFTVDYKI